MARHEFSVARGPGEGLQDGVGDLVITTEVLQKIDSGVPSPHRFTFLTDRAAAIRRALTGKNDPVFVVFYGTSQRDAFSEIVDTFGKDGFKWVGRTLCVLVRHPKAHGTPGLA